MLVFSILHFEVYTLVLDVSEFKKLLYNLLTVLLKTGLSIQVWLVVCNIHIELERRSQCVVSHGKRILRFIKQAIWVAFNRNHLNSDLKLPIINQSLELIILFCKLNRESLLAEVFYEGCIQDFHIWMIIDVVDQPFEYLSCVLIILLPLLPLNIGLVKLSHHSTCLASQIIQKLN